MALYAALLFIGAFSHASNPLNPLENLISKQQAVEPSLDKLQFKTIYTNSELDQHLSLAKQAGLPIFVDFYADWCISCKVMESEVFTLVNIRSKLNQFYLVKADVTENSDENQKLLDRFGLFGPPSMLLFDKAGQELEALRIVGEISAEGFGERLERALEK